MRRKPDDERLSPEDAPWVARMREGFGPEPLDPARAAAFDARLSERRERPARRPWAWAALTTATAAAFAWAVLPAGEATRVEPVAAPNAATVSWEQEVIFGDELGDALSAEDDDLLPPDYLALASAFDF